MKKILAIMPISIGGRLTTSSIIDGFIQNGFEVKIFDELKENNFNSCLNENYGYIVGYDFSPIKLKIDYNLEIPCIAYFSDVIFNKTSGVEFEKYYKYIKNKDIFVFYWDRKLSKKENVFYQPHFVNCEIYKDFNKPIYDIGFMGRFDTSLRLNTFLKLNKHLPAYTFKWWAIEKHYLDALSRCDNNEDKEIIKKSYMGFIDNEKLMAQEINKIKIVYNINAQGESSLNYRTFQVLACKRLIISDKREELDLFNNLIPTYDNFEDLVNKIKYFLTNQNKYDELTCKLAKITEEKFNSKKCIENILKIVQK